MRRVCLSHGWDLHPHALLRIMHAGPLLMSLLTVAGILYYNGQRGVYPSVVSQNIQAFRSIEESFRIFAVSTSSALTLSQPIPTP